MMVSQKSQTMAGGKVETTSYNAPPVGIAAFYDTDKYKASRTGGLSAGKMAVNVALSVMPERRLSATMGREG